tara:strand:- start:51 stop:662 length:612 start_codon:yes stop_codon:yes gene_type:complete
VDLPSYPSTGRNGSFIADTLNLYLPANGHVLETASGTGEHIHYLGKKFPYLVWQPSDKSSDLFWAISERIKNETNILDPIELDLTNNSFPCKNKRYNVILNINMIHIAPWDACIGLFRLAKEVISSDGFLFLYGPFKVEGSNTSASNIKFDTSLRERNPEWGIRNLEDVVATAKNYEFRHFEVHEMPVNNKSVIFQKVEMSNA